MRKLDRKKYVDIIEYTKRGMVKQVEKLINDKIDVNEQDANGNYAVLCAAERNDLTIMKMLVEAGASLDVIGSGGVTPLGYAEYNKNDQMIDFINNTHCLKYK